MYWDVIDIVHPIVKAEADTKRIVQANKLDNAYDIVAADWGVSRSTVVKACGRVLERARETAVFLGRPPKKMNEYFRRKAYPSGSGSAHMYEQAIMHRFQPDTDKMLTAPEAEG